VKIKEFKLIDVHF